GVHGPGSHVEGVAIRRRVVGIRVGRPVGRRKPFLAREKTLSRDAARRERLVRADACAREHAGHRDRVQRRGVVAVVRKAARWKTADEPGGVIGIDSTVTHLARSLRPLTAAASGTGKTNMRSSNDWN